METELGKQKEAQEQERQLLITDYNEQIRGLEKQIQRKQEDLSLMQNELKHVKVSGMIFFRLLA